MKLSEYLNQNGMTLDDFLKMQKRKEEGKTSYGDYQRRLYQEIKSTDLSDIVKDLSSNKFLDQETLTYYNDRVSQVADKLSRFTMGDDKTKKSFLDNLSTLRSGINEASKYYSQWESIDDYDKWKTETSWEDKYKNNTYDEIKAIVNSKDSKLDKDEYSWLKDSFLPKKEYEAQTKADTKALETELSKLESYAELKSKRDLRNSQLISNYIRSGRTREEAASLAAKDEAIIEFDKKLSAYGDMGDYKKALSEKKQFYNNAVRIQEGIALHDNAKNSEDFDKYSKMGADIENPTVDEYYGGFAVGDWRPFGKDSGNKVTYSRANYDEALEKALGATDGRPNLSVYGVNELYTKMTDEEVAIYNYYLSKEGEEKADKFLESITESLNYRKATSDFEDIYKDNAALEYLLGLGAGLEQWGTGVKSLFNTDGEYVPQSVTQIMSGMAREDLNEDYGVIGSGAYDLINTTGNMLPSILVGQLTGGLLAGAGFVNAAGQLTKGAAAVSKLAGAATLGSSAAGNGYQEMLNLGYDKNQAQAYGTLVGVSEAGLEYLLGGISSLGGKLSGGLTDAVVTKLVSNFDNAIAKLAISTGTKTTIKGVGKTTIGAVGNIVGSMVSEFGEEYLQEVLDPVFKNITLKTDEDIKLFSTEALYSGILGALSAGLLEGGSTISGEVSTYKQGKAVKDSGQLSNLKKLGTSFSADTVAYKIASKVNENTDAYTIGQLLHEAGADGLSETNIAEITKSLERKNISPEHAQTIAKWLNKAVEGGYFTKSQIKALENPDISQTFKDVIINQNSTVNQRMQSYTDILQNIANEKENQKANKANAKAEKKANKATTAEETKTTSFVPYSDEALNASKIEALAKELENSGVSPELAQVMAQKKVLSQTEDISTSNTENSIEGKFEVNLEGKTVNVKSGEEVNVSEIATIDNGKMKLKLDNGETVDAEDISFGSEDDNLIYSTVLDMGVNAAVANSLIKNYNPSDKLSAKQYALGIKEAYKYGSYGMPISEISQKGFAADLSEPQRVHAYNLGKADAAAKVEKAQSEVEKVVSGKGGIVGKVYFKGDTLVLKEVQRESLKRMGVLSEVLGVDFHVFESYADKNGNRIFKDTDGKVKKAPNGYYYKGRIYIDLNAGLKGQGTMIYTVAHELGHFIKEWSPAKFKVLADFLMEQYGEKGRNVNDLVQAQIDKAKKNGRTIDFDEAYEEMVCDSLETMLSDDAVYEKILELKAKDASIVKKIGEFFSKIVDNFKKLMQQYPPETPEGKLVSEMKDSFAKLQELFAEALVDASNNYQANEGQKNTTSEGDVKFMARENLDIYTETQYNNFGWIRYNDVLSAAEYNTLLSRYADYKHNKDNYPTTRFGEAVIYSYDYPNILMYVKGTIKNPQITKIFKTKDSLSPEMQSEIQEEILHNERRHLPFPYETIIDFYGEEVFSILKARNYETFRQIKSRAKGESGKGSNTVSEIEQNRARSGITSKTTDKSEHIKRSDRDTNTFSYIQTLQSAVNELRNILTEMQNSEDFKVAHDKLSEAVSNGDVENGIKAYKEWQEKSGYAELSQRRDTLQLELENLRKTFNEEIADKALNEEKEAIAKSGLSEADYFRKQAVKEFGYTPYFYDAGYITPNGKMLNFSGEKGKHYGTRGQDHRAIGIIYANTNGTAALNRFIKDGNIRIMAESPGIDISTFVEPTTEQYSTIRKFIYEYANKEYFNVDLTDENGNVIGSLEYENKINPLRIINDIKHYYATGEIREQSNIDKFRYSDRDNDIDVDTQINQSMTMAECKDMIQRAFALADIYDWYEGEYKNGDEWLKGEGVDEVALNIENEYTLTEKYLNKLQGYLDGDFYVDDILKAYLKGTLTGTEKPKAKRLDTSKEYRINDKRFYSPQRIKDVKKLLNIASTRVTDKNRAEVSNARAKILIFAHNKGASELLGLTQAELNKKLRAWGGYPANARDISRRFNNGVADSNKWTGIENCSWLYRNTVTTEELESLVKSIEGAASDYEKLYIARTMLALDTHIDWSWLSFEFDTNEVVNKKHNGNSRVLGFYRNDGRKIVVSHNQPNTVAHEMGHALDYQWGRDLGFPYSALTEVSRNTKQITDAETKQFFDNFRIFLDSITDNSDIRSEYTQDPKEVFARFIAKFIQWVDNTGTGGRTYSAEYMNYKDNFTAANYIEFVKLLQEKAMLDSKKVAEGEDVKFSDRDTEGNKLSKEQQDFFANSKVRDAEGNLIPVYHGTYENFTIFDINKTANANIFGKGHYFTSSEQDAHNNYASGEGGDVKTKIDSLAYYYFEEMGYTEEDLYDNDHIEEWNKAYDKAEEFYESGKVMKVYLNITNPVYANDTTELYDKDGNFISARSIEGLKELGFDGIIDYHASEKFDFQHLDEGTAHFVVFDSNQIKLTTNTNPTSNPDIRYSERDSDVAENIEKINKQLAKENVKLIEDVKYLKELVKLQGKETHGKILKKSTVELVAKRLMADSNAKGNVSELVNYLTDVYSYIAQGEDVSWETIKEKSKTAVDWLIQHEYSKPVRTELANEILNHLRTLKISLNPMQKKETAYYYGSYGKYHQKSMGRLKITNDGATLDSVWQELSESYPGYFDSDVNSNEQPMELMRVIDNLQNTFEMDEYYYEDEMYTQWLMEKVYDGYWDVSALHTVADAKQKEINLLKVKHKERMDNIRQSHEESDAKLRQEHREKVSKLRTQYREREERKIKKVSEYYQKSRKDAVERVRETKEKRDAITKLQRLVLDTAKWVSYPTKDAVKCPDILRSPYAEFLNSIDLSSKRLLSGGEPTKNDLRVSSAMDSLAKAIEKKLGTQSPDTETETVLDTGYLDLPVHFVENLKEMAENLKKRMAIDGHIVNAMSSEEIKSLTKFIRTLNHSIKEMSTLYSNMRFARVEQLGNDSMLFLDSLGEVKQTGSLASFVTWDNALPYYTFKRFGIAGESVFEELMDAQDKLAHLADEIFKFKEKTWTDKEASEWSKDTHTIKLPSGKELTLTSADAMSIYCLSRREQGRQHLLGGGVRVLGIEKNGKKANDSRSTLTFKDINAIYSSLSERQRKVAEAIQEYMSTVCAEWGNEISMKRFLTKEFTEKHYFPIESNDENLDTKDPKAQQSDLYRLLNISATKPLTKGANNEVIIRNVFDVFTNHSSDMAKLNAYGMALLDYMKWINYREKTEIGDGQITVRGVRKSMEKAYGADAKKYVIGLIKDINGRANDGGDHPFLMKMTRMAKTAMVGANLRVSLLQFTAYPRAAMVLSNKSLALGLTKIPQVDKAKKYCGIALWKSFGFYDTNISRSIEDQIKGTTNIKQKLIELSLKGAEWGDAITWGCLWNACEYEVAKSKKYKVGSEEFNQAVGKKLREVVYATQVVDSTLTRSQMMRNKSGLTQSASAFMSEPTLSANILMDAAFQFNLEKRKTGSAKSAWQKAGKNIGKAIAVYSTTQLFAALVEGLMDAYRDDDDEEFEEKFSEAFKENAISDINPFNKIPIIADVSDLILSWFGIGFSSSNSLYLQAIDEASNAFETWSKVINGEDGKTVYAGIYSTTKVFSYITGTSASGLMREVVTLWNNTAGASDPYLKIRTYETSATDKGIAEYKFDSGDTTAVKTTVSKMVADKVNSGKTEKEAKSDVRSSFTSTYKPQYLAAVEAKDYDEMNRIRKFLYSTGLYGSLSELDETLKKWRTSK